MNRPMLITEGEAAEILGISKKLLQKRRLYETYPGSVWSQLRFEKLHGLVVYDAKSVHELKPLLEEINSKPKRRGPP